MDERFYEAQEQAVVDRESIHPRVDEYDPNSDAFEREIESRIAGERERLWDLRPLMERITKERLSEPPSVAANRHPYHKPLPSPYASPQAHCELCAVDQSLKAHVVAFTHAVDSLEAVVQRLRKFLMVGS